MMKRRKILTTVAMLGGAGCTNITRRFGTQEQSQATKADDASTISGQSQSYDTGADQPPFETDSGVEVRVADAVITHTLVMQEQTRVVVSTADSGSAYLCVKLQVRPTESDSTLPTVGSFTIDGNSSLLVPPITAHLYQPFNGPIYGGEFAGQVDTAESISGWLAFEISTQHSSQTMIGPSLAEKDTHSKWTFPLGDLEKVTFSRRVESPDSVSTEEPVTLSVTVSNTGTRCGHYYRPLTVDCEQWVGTHQRTLSASLAPRESEGLTVTGTVTSSGHGPVIVRGPDQQFVSVPIS